jgi:hypothetical protein
MDDPIRTIIIPVLLLAIIVAIGLYLNREAFADIPAEVDYTCPKRQVHSLKTGGLCKGSNDLPLQTNDDPFLRRLGARRGYEYAGTRPSYSSRYNHRRHTSRRNHDHDDDDDDDNTAVNSAWTYNITDNVQMCAAENGVLIAQQNKDKNGRTRYYPVCYSDGKTDVDSVFNTSNIATFVFSPEKSTVSLYASTGSTGTVVAKTNGSGQDQFRNPQFKSINIVLPAGIVSGVPTDGHIIGNRSGRHSHTNRTGSNLSANHNYANSILNNILLHELAEKSEAELKLHINYNRHNKKPKWPSHTSQEHEDADEKQSEEEEDRLMKEEVQNKLCNNLGKTTCNQIYFNDKEEEDDCNDSPAINQGREQDSAKKKMKCPTIDTNKYIRKDSIPCWGCNIE